MSRDFPTEHVDPPVEECGRVGGGSAEDAALRLACLIEARQQMERSDAYGFADILYRAHYNARFVLEGRTPVMRRIAAAQAAVPMDADSLRGCLAETGAGGGR